MKTKEEAVLEALRSQRHFHSMMMHLALNTQEETKEHAVQVALLDEAIAELEG